MKKFALGVLVSVSMLAMACGGSGDTCPTGEVKVGTVCKKSCTQDSDCGANMECHKDEGAPHCDAKDAE
ncbi:MAG: hypothetical protein EP343_14685 [Deltaproteobacteria bacterium]|nr:MAG: hypothetical protein EP343_14685 [Deltaproteobacteria bacterium]